MPTSNLACWLSILNMAHEVKPRSVLDVGPGYGKGGLLCREYLPPLDRLDAIEAEARYADQFPWLDAIYDNVHLADVRAAPHAYFDAYDLVLMIDVLEHVTHDEGADLLRRIRPRVIVCTPRDFFQNPNVEEWPTEMHRSVWTAAEIAFVRSIESEDVAVLDTLGGVLVRCAPL